MGLSFEESLNTSLAQNSVNMISLKSIEPTDMVASSDMDNDQTEWVLSDKYQFYEEYYDENYSYIDEDKNIILTRGQINITQEANSQYVPFEMYRYYDGFDLMNTSIVVHFVNVNCQEGYSSPINLYYTEEKIRFAWLIDKRVTAISGNISFEIIAIGKNSKGNTYIWKTKSIDKVEVLCSLSGNGEILVDEDWIANFVLEMQDNVETVENAIEEVKTLSDQTKNNLLIIADQTKIEMREIADNSKNEIDSAIHDATAELNTAKENVITYIENFAIENEQEIEEFSDQIKSTLTNDISVAMSELQTFVNNTRDNLQNDMEEMVVNFSNRVDLAKADIKDAIDRAMVDIQIIVEEAKTDINETINFVEISNASIDAIFNKH